MWVSLTPKVNANHHLNYWPIGIAKDCSPYHACTFNNDLPHLGGPSHTDSSIGDWRTHILIAWVKKLKAIFHSHCIVAKRSVFHCFVNTQAEVMIWTQWNMLRFATIRLKWKTGLTTVSLISRALTIRFACK